MAEPRPYETRTVAATVELRDEDSAPVLTGYAATFNEPYQIGYFRERIHPDAFRRTLTGSPDVRLLIDHEGQPLARTKSGTLTLSTDHRGLQVRATLDPSDPDVQRLLPKMRRGDLDQMSFAFRVPAGGDTWDYSGDVPDRTIREANLSGGDVSVVTYPANEATEAQVRARDERESAYVLAEAMLREVRAGTQFDLDNVERLHDALEALGIPLTRAAQAEVTEVTPEDVPEPGLPLDLARRLQLAAELRRLSA
ncbi:MAG TPA: HK97 family phage prohead protease [Mycobacteriales bacterium]|nr:HK97 family phage prohead protease [Mycobacteriales bacterium]